jgi:1-acyl-sn-glycerol-3-phosphate acyltransferase
MKKALGKFILWLLRWKVNPIVPPEVQRCVMIAAPHTSNWDFFLVVLAFWVLEIPMKVAIKDDWTKFPFGWFVKSVGGLGIDRRPKKVKKEVSSQVDQMAQFFKSNERIALVIAPEGTRRKREQWKMGFYYVAKKAEVPITFGYLDYKNKIAGVGPKGLHISDNMDEDLQSIMSFYQNIQGRTPEWFSIDTRYLPS